MARRLLESRGVPEEVRVRGFLLFFFFFFFFFYFGLGDSFSAAAGRRGNDRRETIGRVFVSRGAEVGIQASNTAGCRCSKSLEGEVKDGTGEKERERERDSHAYVPCTDTRLLSLSLWSFFVFSFDSFRSETVFDVCLGRQRRFN